jgi:hypothetical protein
VSQKGLKNKKFGRARQPLANKRPADLPRRFGTIWPYHATQAASAPTCRRPALSRPVRPPATRSATRLSRSTVRRRRRGRARTQRHTGPETFFFKKIIPIQVAGVPTCSSPSPICTRDLAAPANAFGFGRPAGPPFSSARGSCSVLAGGWLAACLPIDVSLVSYTSRRCEIDSSCTFHA